MASSSTTMYSSSDDWHWQNEFIADRAHHYSKPTHVPTQDVITHAVLSNVAYSLEGNDQHHERVNAALKSDHVRGLIGDGWRVVQRADGTYLSTEDSVVVENVHSGSFDRQKNLYSTINR
jgi:hypothetical protein